MRLLIVNGPNINMIGKRNIDLYGEKNYKTIVNELKKYAKEKKVKLRIYQSNSEEKLVNHIQKNYLKYDGYIVNLGALTHYSYSIRDALELLRKPIVEVHFSNIDQREKFRQVDVLEGLIKKKIIGKKDKGYYEAIDFIINEGIKND